MLVRDGGCARPGCSEDRPERLHAHHLRHWLHGGRTDVDDLVLLCDRDHGAVHDLDLTLHRRAGRLVAHAVDGTPVWQDEQADGGPAPLVHVADPSLPLGWPANGERLDLRYAIGVLLDNREVLRRHLQEEAAGRLRLAG
ncbi:HNH endonuclease signature motif containing protein [Klenkia sp. PcliD-1-E]|uniref:HNH endonuclease signature motif containing protein n=1 Tax=Klenkia sp. PcliD-1-E TaxID=2954492 RepID=UPI0027DF879B|nr:HNH endonuclease signature motif containing protein [Klenkia sp. PcliD-1-E]